MTTANQERSGDHWTAIVSPDMDNLTIQDKAAMIAARVQDLMGDELQSPRQGDRWHPPQVTRSEQGTERMRAFFGDPDTSLGYFDKDQYTGVVAPDEKGAIYLERYLSHRGQQEVYHIDTVEPDNSAAFWWNNKQESEAAPIPTDRALNLVLNALGKLANAHGNDDYDGTGKIDPHQFGHPDLHGDRLRLDGQP